MTQARASQPHRLRNIIGGSAGNLVEWYDWYAYTALALYFAPAFFPSGDRTAQLLSAAAVFAVGFVMRPIGAWLMGIYADRRGRKAGLTLSAGLMCAGSLMIAVIPGYAEIGRLAPALLVVARLLQGLSLGGEYGASAVYLSEMAGEKRRGFFSSFQYVTLIAGQLIASAVLLVLQLFLTEAQLDLWGWRIPFAIGALLALAVFYIRRRLTEFELDVGLTYLESDTTAGLCNARLYEERYLLLTPDDGPLAGRASVGWGEAVSVPQCALTRQMQNRRILDGMVAGWLEDQLSPRGVGVVIEAEHTCMTLRGVQARGTTTVTSALRGVLREDPRSRQEFFALTVTEARHG